MRKSFVAGFLVTASMLAFGAGCEDNRTPGQKVEDAVDVGANRVGDAVDATQDGIEDAGDSIEDATDGR